MKDDKVYQCCARSTRWRMVQRSLLPALLVLTLLAAQAWVMWERDYVRVDSDQIDVAVLIPGDVEYFRIQRNYLEQMAEEAGMRFSFYDAGWSHSTQLRQLENALSSNYDAVAVCAINLEVLGRSHVSELAREHGGLFTFTNHDGERKDVVVSHVGHHQHREGRLLAQLVEEFYGTGPLRIGVIKGPSTAPASKMRGAGFEEELRQYEHWQVDWAVNIEGWREQEVNELVNEEMLQSVDVVVAFWHLAADICAKNYPEVRAKYICLECAPETRRLINEGVILAATNPRLEYLTRMLLDVIGRAHEGDVVEKVYWVDHEVLRKER